MRSDYSLSNKHFPILGGCSEGLDALGYYADSTAYEKGKEFLLGVFVFIFPPW